MMNARLKNVFSLSSKVTVYVPATIDIDKEIDNKEFVDRAATLDKPNSRTCKRENNNGFRLCKWKRFKKQAGSSNWFMWGS